jgi:membrane-bound lytic murein transglycosylase D
VDKSKAAKLMFCDEVVPFDQVHVLKQYELVLQKVKSLSINRLKERSEKYFAVIEPILAKYHIPNDFKYISIVESGLTANATSSAGAHGYWQFMPETARAMGLKVSRKVDERTNLVKSTHAACRYFNHLYDLLGSWSLVAAAYNAGPGKVNYYMEAAQSMSYFDFKAKKETQEYVYRILAVKALFTGQKLELLAAKNEVKKSVEKTAIPTNHPPQPLSEPLVAKIPLPTVKSQILSTQLIEAGIAQRGQTWVFEITENSQIGDVFLQKNDKLYATIEDVDLKKNRVYLRSVRLYSPRRHEMYSIPLTATSNDSIGISLNIVKDGICEWKKI